MAFASLSPPSGAGCEGGLHPESLVKSSPMEIKQDTLLRVLVKMLAFLKEQRVESLRLSTEVAALRNTLQELSGDRFLPIVEKHRKELQGKGSPIAASIVGGIDELIPLIVEALPSAKV